MVRSYRKGLEVVRKKQNVGNPCFRLSVYDTWKNFPEITPVFAKLSSINNPTQISEAVVQDSEQFVVSLYSRTVNANKLNNARRILFAKGFVELSKIYHQRLMH